MSQIFPTVYTGGRTPCFVRLDPIWPPASGSSRVARGMGAERPPCLPVSCDSEGSSCHGNCHIRKLRDKIVASRNRTSSGCLEGAVSGFVFKFKQEKITGHGWLKKGQGWGEEGRGSRLHQECLKRRKSRTLADSRGVAGEGRSLLFPSCLETFIH
jgi:hypothetical protein